MAFTLTEILVTPAMAQDWLTRNLCKTQRPLRITHVRSLALAMRAEHFHKDSIVTKEPSKTPHHS